MPGLKKNNTVDKLEHRTENRLSTTNTGYIYNDRSTHNAHGLSTRLSSH